MNIINLFNQLETPDLRAALGKSFREYQLASSTPASIAALSSGRGGMITDPEFTASSVTALGGLALKSGVPTGDLVQDFMARAAGVQTASECAEAGTSITTLSQSRTQALHVNSLGNHLFQSGFASGQAYARRLASLRAHVSLHSYTATPDTQTWESLVDLTGKAAAEPRAWAGPGRFVADASARRGTNQISTLNLWVFGYEPSDWGATSPDEMPTQIGLLYGEPWEADCAAGLRDNCAKSIIGAGLRNPATVSVGASSDSLTSVFGFDGPMLTLSFNYSSELDLVPPTFAGSQLPSKHFYVILKRDPHQPQAKGKVLAAFDLRTPNRAVSTVDSALQRKLLNQTLGIPSNYPSTSTKLGATNLSLSESYCLGLPWNKFIPLENELTSNTQENSGYEDSWQHYLNLAEVAAAHADELGEKLIDLGIQKDMRREAAGEALANICGVHGALDKVSEDSQHKIAAAPDDGNLQECLGETKADVLFLGADPYKGMSEEVATDTIRSKVFLCDDPDPKKHHNLCDKKGPLTHAGLDLFASEEATSLTDCSAISKVVPSMESGMKTGAIQQAQSSSWASKTKLQAAVSSLSFTLNRDASWTLSYGGSVVMNSKFNNSRIWPGCTRAGAADCYLPGDDFDRNELLARHFERAFRSGAGTLGTHDNFLYQQPSNPDDLDTWKADAEAMAIGWRVQAALWTLGRMAGFIPEGLFNVPVPGVYLSDTNQTVHGMVPHPGKVPMLTLFNRSRYTFVEETDGVPLFQLKTGEQLKDQDINIVGKVKPIPGNYNFGSPNELPFWMHHIYGGPSITGHPKSYLMTKAKNKAIVVQHRFKDTLKEFFGNQAAAYQGIVCKDAGHVAFDGPEYTAPGVPPWSAHLEFIELKNSMPMTLDLNVLETALPATGTPWGKTKARDGGAPSAVEMVLVAGAGNASAYSVVRDLFGYYYTDSFIDPLARGYYQQKDAVPYLKEIYEDTLGPDGFTGAMGDLRWAERPGFGTEVDTDATNECNPAWVEGMHFIDPSPSSGVDCLEPFDVTANLQDIHHRPAWTMLPRAVPPSDRVQFFINAGPPQGVCGAAAQLAQALVLSCELSDPASIPPPSSPPNVKSIDDLFGLSLYLGVVESSVNASASGLYATSIPQRSVDAAKASEQVGGPLKGTHAEPVLQMSRSLRAIAQDWINIRTTLGAMRESSHAAYLQLKQVDLQTQQKAVELTLREIDVDSSTANQIAAAVTACSVPITVGKSFAVSATFNPIACGAAVVNAAVQINLNGERLSNLETLKELAGESQDVSALVIISDLNTKMREYYKVLTENFTNLYNEIASLQSASVQLAGLESEAQYQAAVGSGADYYVDEATNEPVAIPVNTVQRRLYDITANRYKDALKHAKYQAYFARLAIEQRLGVRLSTLQNAIGPLEPPAEWADDVCTLQGIDYQKLCESKLPGGKTSICGFQSGDGSGGNVSSLSEEELIENFADQYIGDYVRKLKDFVEYYNIQYPSHDGEDLAVLSFKDSLLASTGPCQSLSRNLLYYSSDLDSRDVVNEDGTQVVRGWQYTPCAVNGQCLQVVSGEGIEFSPNDDILDPGSPTQSANNAFVWLYDVAPATPPDSGNIAVSVLPRKAVHQKVSLTSGTNYILSWWDMAVSKNGGPWEPGPDQAVPEQAYLIGVYDANGVAQATRMEPASYKVVDGKQVWSDRLNLQFQVDQSGDYEVVVAASSTLDTNSLLIGGIQLENGASLTPYSDVTSTRLTPSLICEAERTAEDVQGAFEHKCAGNICWYELEAPIVLDTSIAGTTQSPLFGILAAGNFNYRDISIALNLVGTGILNCSQNGTSTCYSSSYVEYTLEHDAFDVGVTSWHKQGGDFEEQDFNFGLATIEHGKGLTAERVITSPIASSDAELIQQLSVEKGEFRGRPLDGVYRLKIWDKPELRWNKLQDIQFVVKYRYWSKIRAGL